MQFLFITFMGLGGTPVADAVARVERAYAVDRLLAAKTVRLEEELRMPFAGHDYSAGFHDLAAQRRVHVLDLKGRSGSSEYLTAIGNSHYHARSVLHGGTFRFIDYGASTYQDQGSRTFDAHYGATFRASDVLLAVALVQGKDSVRFAGRKMWLGRTHDAVTFDQAGSPPLTVYIETNTGHITRMTRTAGNGTVVDYTFDHHGRDDGIAIAREHSVYARGEPLYFSFGRRLVLNGAEDRDAFHVEKGIPLEPKRIDTESMSVRAVGHHGHHVGRGETFSTFFQTDSGVVAFGLQAGFAERLQAYRKKTEIAAPLVAAVAADHQAEDHAGARDAADAGATLVVTGPAETAIREAVGEGPTVEVVTSSRRFGALTVHALATAHAEQVLVLWQPSSRLLVQSGHYISPFETAIHYAKFTAFSLRGAVDAKQLKPRSLLSSASARPETWAAFLSAVARYDGTACHRNRRICRGWIALSP
ncbi:MAG: hypothetical protein AAFX94_03680 [Myxococcota bacterium]